MITKFKIYEAVNETPKVGDYVLINANKNLFSVKDPDVKDYLEFIGNSVGKITNVNDVHNNVAVKYQDIPNHIKYIFNVNTVLYPPSHIEFIAKNPEEVELQIKAKKYNL